MTRLQTRRRPGGLLAVLAVALVVAVLLPGRGSVAAGAVRVGDLTVSGATLPRPASPDVASVYLTVRNGGGTADTLLDARSDAGDAPRVMAEHVDGTMGDTGPLVVPAHGSVVLTTGRQHLMLASPRPGLREGSTVHVTLVFSHAGAITVPVTVTPIGSRG